MSTDVGRYDDNFKLVEWEERVHEIPLPDEVVWLRDELNMTYGPNTDVEFRGAVTQLGHFYFQIPASGKDPAVSFIIGTLPGDKKIYVWHTGDDPDEEAMNAGR